MSYIVKNCPAFTQTYEHCCNLDGNYKCEGCTDCVIKQVIEECKQANDIYQKEEFYDDDRDVFMGQSNMANMILNMFDIEEINK